ncbi:MAG: endonuclease/exonuclease/phosphatase family protein [Sphingobium sp.]|nr:endonuclease/exonuclease/phosphatase family protein [Sphingobium sp.]MCP5398873.1 endonuclease/exonuclease/phosphatase family protein [Sphingomonas sp.]
MSAQTIRIASYNIRKAIGTDRRRNPERIIAVLAELDADIIALQEADRRFGPRIAAIPPMLLDHHSDYKPAPLNVQTDSIGWHGNAILVRKSAQIVMSDIIHLPYLEPRGAVVAHVDFGHAELRLFGMHLDLSGLWRRKQAAAVIHAYGLNNEIPTLLAGDLNEWSAARGCLADFGRHFHFAPCGRSFHAQRPVAQLDRIMHCGQLELLDCGVHDSILARRASDHLPIWADVRLK